jgi:esterase
VNLFYRKYGSRSNPLFILHGLFGQCDNWQTIAKGLAADGHEIYTVDQRNHGLSFHSDQMNYPAMARDLNELITDLGFSQISLLGHSMGGKTALQFAISHPEKVRQLFVADIAPRSYPPHHQQIIAALKQIDFDNVKTRKAAEAQLSVSIPDFSTRQFLLKNLYWKSDARLDWRFNLKAIEEHISELGAQINFQTPNRPDLVFTQKDFQTCFIRGGNSKYLSDDDAKSIHRNFPDARIETIPGAGHWLHADKPQEFISLVHSLLLV